MQQLKFSPMVYTALVYILASNCKLFHVAQEDIDLQDESSVKKFMDTFTVESQELKDDGSHVVTFERDVPDSPAKISLIFNVGKECDTIISYYVSFYSVKNNA